MWCASRPSWSPVCRVLRPRCRDARLEAVADRQQLRLVDHVLPALLEVVLEDVGLHDRVHRATLLAEAAEDALEQVNVVARGAARAVGGARAGFDRDRQRRTHRLAQLARDAALLPGRIP